MTDERALAVAAAVALEPAIGAVTRVERVGGGSVSRALRFHGERGRAFVKTTDAPAAGEFASEAAGLAASAASGTTLRVPRVLAVSDASPAFLALEDLGAGRARGDHDEAVGRGLAKLHRATDPRGFGFECDTFCGGTRQDNHWLESWVEFFRERRLAPLLGAARERGLERAEVAAIERLTRRLERFGFPGEPSALIHGDLWSGNLVVAADGRPALIDPSASFSHREAELGMMLLFGGFSDRVFAAYHAEFPLAPGWRERAELTSVYHLLNHFRLFGGGYGRQAASLARRFAG